MHAGIVSVRNAAWANRVLHLSSLQGHDSMGRTGEANIGLSLAISVSHHAGLPEFPVFHRNLH